MVMNFVQWLYLQNETKNYSLNVLYHLAHKNCTCYIHTRVPWICIVEYIMYVRHAHLQDLALALN